MFNLGAELVALSRLNAEVKIEVDVEVADGVTWGVCCSVDLVVVVAGGSIALEFSD